MMSHGSTISGVPLHTYKEKISHRGQKESKSSPIPPFSLDDTFIQLYFYMNVHTSQNLCKRKSVIPRVFRVSIWRHWCLVRLWPNELLCFSFVSLPFQRGALATTPMINKYKKIMFVLVPTVQDSKEPSADICISSFITSLFITTQTWKHTNVC